jgi:hypothetical protein
MSVGITDSLGRYYWRKTAGTIDANYWYYRLPKKAKKSEYNELGFQI